MDHYHVYILQNTQGQFYVGHTDDLQRGVANHNRTDKISGKFTGKNGPDVVGINRLVVGSNPTAGASFRANDYHADLLAKAARLRVDGA